MFAHVVGGKETLSLFSSLSADSQERPLREIRIFHTTVLINPFRGVYEKKKRNSVNNNVNNNVLSINNNEKTGMDEEKSVQKPAGFVLPPRSTTAKTAPVGKYIQGLLNKKKNKNSSSSS